MRLHRLVLTEFRNYQRCLWQPSSSIAVISGANGSGKTNLLEALSLLAPGRGLRQSSGADFFRRDGLQQEPPCSKKKSERSKSWGITATLERNGQIFDLSTGLSETYQAPGSSSEKNTTSSRRHFLLDGQIVRTQAEIATYYSCIWLTPQMDRIFVENASGRRRFLDRLVVAFSPDHARQMAAHERSVASRNRLLATHPEETLWLDSLEASISRHAVAAIAARLTFVERMNNLSFKSPEMAINAAINFPASYFVLHCPIAEKLQKHPALWVEEWLRDMLRDNRIQDREKGSTSLGAHRTDFSLYDKASHRPASLSSSGQQKLMLLGIILTHAIHVARNWGEGPLLLLDEPLVHLDDLHRNALLELLPHLTTDLNIMAFLTGTEKENFSKLSSRAEFVSVQSGHLQL